MFVICPFCTPFLDSAFSSLVSCKVIFPIRLHVLKNLNLKSRLNSSILRIKVCWFLKRRGSFNISSTILQKRLRSISWSLLEISFIICLSALSQKPSHIFFSKKLLLYWTKPYRYWQFTRQQGKTGDHLCSSLKFAAPQKHF